MGQSIRGVWEHVSSDHAGSRVGGPSELECLPLAEGGTVGPVQRKHVGGDFFRYEATVKGDLLVPVAYECGHCEAIVVGQPEMRNPQERVAEDAPASVTGYDTYCGECGELMYRPN